MKANGKISVSQLEVPREIFIVVFEDGCITSFKEEKEAEAFRKSIKRETTLARYVVEKGKER